jgi:hypothetical protein
MPVPAVFCLENDKLLLARYLNGMIVAPFRGVPQVRVAEKYRFLLAL